MVKKTKNNEILVSAEGKDIPMMAEIETIPTEDTKEEDLTGELPVMPLRNLMIFPSIVMPINVGRQPTLKLVNQALQSKEPIVITTQKVGETESPKQKDLFPIAVIGKVLRVFEMPGGTITAILQATGPKVKLEEITSTRPFLRGKVSVIEEDMQDEKSDEFKTLIDTCKELSAKVIELSDEISPDTAFALKNLDNNEVLVNFISGNFPFPINEKYELLQMNDLKSRLYRLIQLLNKTIQLATLKQNIQMRTREELDRQQREYFLQQQIKNIQDELGNGQDDEIDELQKKGEKKLWKPEVKEIFDRELAKLERINPQSPDYNVQLTYLQTLLSLPWGVYTKDVIDIPNAKKILDKERLRTGEGERTYSGIPGRAEAERRPEIADYLPLRPSGSRQDLTGTLHRHGPEAEICPHVTGWRTRRGGNPRTPQDVYRCHAGTYHQEPDQGGDLQPGHHPGRD